MLSFFPRGVLDEILNLIESVSEGFPSYSYTAYSSKSEMNIYRVAKKQKKKKKKNIADSILLEEYFYLGLTRFGTYLLVRLGTTGP